MNKKELIKKIEELENEDVTLSDLRRLFASLEGYEFGRLDKNKYSTFYVYVMYHNKKVLYVGRTVNIRDRFINHMKGSEYKEWKDTITHIEIYTADCPYEMVSLEGYLIYKLYPEYNAREEMFIKEFKLSKLKKTIMTKEKFLATIQNINVKESNVIETLETYLKKDKPEKVILIDWIRENFYDKHTAQETIKSTYKSIRNKINIDGYKLIVLKGRGQKAYLEIKGELSI